MEKFGEDWYGNSCYGLHNTQIKNRQIKNIKLHIVTDIKKHDKNGIQSFHTKVALG